MTDAAKGTIRTATPRDLAAMMALEQACFSLDAQSRRSMRYLLGQAHGETRVVDDNTSNGALSGYVMWLYKRGTRVARLYSIGVDPDARGRGLAARLLADAVARAQAAGCRVMRAEARTSNVASRALFRAAGFVETGALPGYYPGEAGQDDDDGVRMECPLADTCST